MTMINQVEDITPKNKNRSPELDAFAGIEASPLVTQNLIDRIKPKNSEIQLFWGNSVAGDGLRISQLLFAGFEIAKPEDLINVPLLMIKNGQIRSGDLTCLKISKAKYYGALKHNHNEAIRRGNRMQQQQDQKVRVQREVVGSAPNEIAAKVKAFTPSEDDLKRMTDDKT